MWICPRHRPWQSAWVLLLLPLLLVSAGCGLIPVEHEEEPPTLIAPVKSEKSIYTVTRGPILDKLRLRATIVPAHEADLYFKTGGRIKAVHARAGDQVRAGQLLVELEIGELSYDLALARIAYERASVALQAALAATASEGDPFAVKLRELELEQARIGQERLTERLSSSRLVAPFAGLISSVAKQQGDLIANFEPMIRITDPTDLAIEAEVSDLLLGRLALGQRVQLHLDELKDGGGEGQIVSVPGFSSSGPRRVRIAPDQFDPAARLGLSGRVDILLQAKADVLLLPNAGLRQFVGRTYVLLQTAQGRREVDVVTGIVGETDTEITRGLAAGDQVIGR